jgi:hypothetical protein
MEGEYKRPTKIIDLPSGKKIEIVTYFTNFELDEIKKATMKGVKFTGEQAIAVHNKKLNQEDLMKDVELSINDMVDGNQKRLEFAIKKLIDEEGKEYEATVENIRNFLDEYDAIALGEAFATPSKKK